MKIPIKTNQAGFTLIEFIVTLVIAASAAAMLYAFMGTTLTRSSEPIFRLQKSSNLHQVMENIVADYNRLNALNLRYKWQALTIYGVGNVVIPTTSTGYYYTCTNSGTSGAAQPTWPTTTGSTVTNGTTIWKVGGVIWKSSGTPVENIVWHTSRVYLVGDIMIPIKNTGHYYRCATAGTSSNSIPGAWRPSTVYAANTIVVPPMFNGRFYRSTAGTSGTTQPVWPVTDGGTVADNTMTWTEVPDGTLRWTEAGTILNKTTTTASNNDDVLNDNIYNYLTTTPARYGTGYTVVSAETKFVKFSSGAEQDAVGADEESILKITIQDSATGERLTQLFTIR